MLNILKKPKQCSYLLITLTTVGIGIEHLKADGKGNYTRDDTDQVYMKYLGKKPHHIEKTSVEKEKHVNAYRKFDEFTVDQLTEKEAEAKRISAKLDSKIEKLENILELSSRGLLSLSKQDIDLKISELKQSIARIQASLNQDLQVIEEKSESISTGAQKFKSMRNAKRKKGLIEKLFNFFTCSSDVTDYD